jgi:periplasmic protein CpxP/Spy
MMTRLPVAALAGLLMLIATPDGAGAQRPPDNARRAELEQQVRQRMGRMLRERVGLTDEQFQRVVEVNRGFEARRRTLVEQERDVRIGLRQEVLLEDKADQERVARLLEQAVEVQRRRLQLLEEEQRALAQFLTPVQRAKYMAVQEQIHRAVEEMRRPGAARAPGARRPG